MSRSYKKNPFVTDHKRKVTKHNKKLANRKFRRTLELYQNGEYKKYTESWDICDYKWRSTKQDAVDWYINECDNTYIKGRYPTLEKYLNYWAKCAVRK